MADAVTTETLTIVSASPSTLRKVGAPLRFEAVLTLPAGAPPFPAALVHHRGSAARVAAQAAGLAEAGFASLAVDSFAARSLLNRAMRGALQVTGAMRLADAFAARNALAAHPHIDAGAIAIVGLGSLGETAILTAYTQIAGRFADDAAPFAAHVSVLGCPAIRLVDYRTTGAPVTIITADDQDNATQGRPALIVGDLAHGGSPVNVVALADPLANARRGAPNGPGVARRLDPNNRLVVERPGGPFAGALRRIAVGAGAGVLRTGAPALSRPLGAACAEAVLGALTQMRDDRAPRPTQRTTGAAPS